MKALILGAGMQGKAVIHDLSQSPLVEEIIAADLFPTAIQEYIKDRGYTNVRVVGLDASDEGGLIGLIQDSRADIVLCLLPAHMSHEVAKACIYLGRPFVNTSYGSWVADLDEGARTKGVTVLPEMGLDPGIDLVLGGLAVGELDEVEGLYSYGAGVPARECLDGCLNYKITWTFDGVLKAYRRPARMLKAGREVSIPGLEIFREENLHLIDVPGLGQLEAYPNGDALHFAQTFGLGTGLREMGRFAARWPGHAAFWRIMAEMGFLDDEPLDLGEGLRIAPRQFLVQHLTPRLQFRDGEQDVVLLRIQAWGLKDGRRLQVIYEIVDRRDLQTGFFAMNRTVGYTASIAAQMVLSGEISRPGVLSPVRDVPGQRLLEELKARGIQVSRRVSEMEG